MVVVAVCWWYHLPIKKKSGSNVSATHLWIVRDRFNQFLSCDLYRAYCFLPKAVCMSMYELVCVCVCVCVCVPWPERGMQDVEKKGQM